MTIFIAQMSRLLLVMIATVLTNSVLIQKIHAQAVDYTSTLQTKNDSTTAKKNHKIIKMRLKTPGINNEWLRIEVNGNIVKPIHTIRTNKGFSGIVNGALSAVSPVPLPNLRFDKWLDAPTTRVVFQPDSCSMSQPPQPSPISPVQQNQVSPPPQPPQPPQPSPISPVQVSQSSQPPPISTAQVSQMNCLATCAIAGTDSVLLPEGTDIYKGRFTIEYTEGDLLRSITFRIRDEGS